MVSDKLKILIISKQFPPIIGGGGSHANYLARALSKNDAQVIVLTSTVKNKPKEHRVNDNLVIYRKYFEPTQSLPYESAIESGLGICEKIVPDVIHGQHLAGAFIGLHLKASFGIPLVVTLHKTPLSTWDETKPKQHSAYSYLKLLSRLEIIDLFIAGSKAFEQELVNIGVKTEKIRLIYHGIPVKDYKKLAYRYDIMSSVISRLNLNPNKSFKIDGELEDDLIEERISKKFIQTFATNGFSLKDNPNIIREKDNGWTIVDDDIFIVKKDDEKLSIYPVNVIICPSRIDEKRKNLGDFVKACGLLHQRINNRNFIFLITGEANNKDEKDHQHELEHIASKKGIKDCLKFISFKAEELPALYRLAKVCVLPSLREGLGLALLEALAVRTPIVGTNVLGINEVIETNGKYGLFFDVGDFDALGKQLLNVVSNHKMREKLKRDGFHRVKEKFDAKLMANKHLECYKELIHEKRLTGQ